MSDRLQVWADTFGARSANLPGHDIDWLNNVRSQALDRFMTEGWPTPKMEAWHHTSLSPLAAAVFSDGEEQSVKDQLAALKQAEEGHWLVFVDGSFNAELSDLTQLPNGVTATALSQSWGSDADAIQEFYGSAEDGYSTSALNLAFASDGAWVNIKSGVVVEKPIHLVFATASPKAAHFLRNLIRAEANAHASIVEHYIGPEGATNLKHAITKLDVAQDARVSHIKMQQESNTAWHLGEIRVTQGKGSYFASHSISLGGRLARNDIATRFLDERCETLLNGLYCVDKRRHVDHQTHIGHEKPNCVSHESYRGIMADTSHGVFCGRILVSPGADGTDAIQRNDSLLLSRLAKSDARPELEIYADDVKCAHGATVGQMDKDSLFYLRSRGINEARAREILIYAFAAASVAKIESDAMRKYIESAVKELLPGAMAVESAL